MYSEFDKNFVLLGYAPSVYTDKKTGEEKTSYILHIGSEYAKVKGYQVSQAICPSEVVADLDLEKLLGSTLRTVCSYNKVKKLLFVKKIIFVDEAGE